jgi:hypothetical protein
VSLVADALLRLQIDGHVLELGAVADSPSEEVHSPANHSHSESPSEFIAHAEGGRDSRFIEDRAEEVVDGLASLLAVSGCIVGDLLPQLKDSLAAFRVSCTALQAQ